MKKFEYKIIRSDDITTMSSTLTNLGQTGWELISVTEARFNSMSLFTYFLKREIIEQTKKTLNG